MSCFDLFLLFIIVMWFTTIISVKLDNVDIKDQIVSPDDVAVSQTTTILLAITLIETFVAFVFVTPLIFLIGYPDTIDTLIVAHVIFVATALISALIIDFCEKKSLM